MFYVCFLAFPSLNHWRTHTECARVLCPSTLVWCSLQVTRGDHEDNVRVLHVKFSCSCVQTREFFKKYSSRVTKYTSVGDTRVSSYNRAVLYVQTKILRYGTARFKL